MVTNINLVVGLPSLCSATPNDTPAISHRRRRKSSSLGVVQQVAMPQLHWPEKASMLSFLRRPSSRGWFFCTANGTLIKTLIRYHIGESLLPSVRPFLRFIGAEEAVINYGFALKVCCHSRRVSQLMEKCSLGQP